MSHHNVVSDFNQPMMVGAQSKRLVCKCEFVHIGPGYLGGVFVAHAKNLGGEKPLITFFDGTETEKGEVIVGPFTPQDAMFYCTPAVFGGALWIDIAGDVDCTVCYT